MVKYVVRRQSVAQQVSSVHRLTLTCSTRASREGTMAKRKRPTSARQRPEEKRSNPSSPRTNPNLTDRDDTDPPATEAPRDPVNVYDRPSGLRRYPTWLIALVAVLVVALIIIVIVFLI
jgi:hypothetical protein